MQINDAIPFDTIKGTLNSNPIARNSFSIAVDFIYRGTSMGQWYFEDLQIGDSFSISELKGLLPVTIKEE